MNTENFVIGSGIAFILLFVVGFIGWIANIIQVIGMDNIFNSTLGIVKLVGILVAPVGAILGVVGIF